MASTYLSKTFGTATDRRKWTFSAWIKRSTNTSEAIFSSYSQDTTSWYSRIADNGSGRYDFTEYSGSAYTINLRPNARQRDVNGWYHIVWMYDSAQATPSDRVKYYINGEQITSWDDSSFPTTFPAQNKQSGINKAQAHAIGKNLVNPDGSYFNGSMSHIHFTDGYAYDASAFGETDATTGIWKPIIEPSVTYGNNGFFLKFENSGSMGTDSSGNGNNFAVNGNLTQTVDTPTNVFCTMNPLDNYFASSTFANGNTSVTTGSSSSTYNTGTLGMSAGKWYWEMKMTSSSPLGNLNFGIVSSPSTSSSQRLRGASTTNNVACPDYNYAIYANGVSTGINGEIVAQNDIVMFAFDADNNALYIGRNGSWYNSGDPTSGASKTGGFTPGTAGLNYFPAVGDESGSAGYSVQYNFGNGYFGTTPVSSAGSNGNGAIFEYDVPTGYYALNTKNINTYG